MKEETINKNFQKLDGINIEVKNNHDLYNLVLKTHLSFNSDYRKNIVNNLEDINGDSFTGIFRLIDDFLVYQYNSNINFIDIDHAKNESIASISSCKQMIEVLYG